MAFLSTVREKIEKYNEDKDLKDIEAKKRQAIKDEARAMKLEEKAIAYEQAKAARAKVQGAQNRFKAAQPESKISGLAKALYSSAAGSGATISASQQQVRAKKVQPQNNIQRPGLDMFNNGFNMNNPFSTSPPSRKRQTTTPNPFGGFSMGSGKMPDPFSVGKQSKKFRGGF